MKLKWKIFLISLVFIMIAVAVTALTVLQINFSSAVSAEREGAAAYHSYFASSASSRLMYERMTGSVAVLEDEQIDKALSDIALDYASFGEAEALVLTDTDGSSHIGGADALIDTSKLPDASSLESGQCSTCIYDRNDMTVLAAVSSFELEGETLLVYTAHDITETYTSFEELSRLAGIVSIAFALFISLVLFVFTALLLRPLSKLNASLSDIAEGDYKSRTEEKGSEELREIAQNINIMAEAVEENVERLEGIAEGRKHYVDSLAHEMKTPLTSILCYGDLLRIKRDVSDSERLEYSGVIVDEAKRLKNLSSKLLELACADSAELDFENVSVLELLSEVETAMSPALEAKAITLKVGGENAVIRADRELFKSLIYNLIDNAAKASDAGKSVEVSSRRAENGIIICVRDYGIGMTRDVLKKVSEPFYMADKSRSRKAGGAGLGLSLCVEIARRHGSRISMKSKPGVGTAVYITVPYAAAEGGANENEK